MNKIFLYLVFIVTSVVMLLLFVTAKTYDQLAAATILYPIFVFFTLDFVFPRKKAKGPFTPVSPIPSSATMTASSIAQQQEMDTETITSIEVADIDKRAFLKLVGVAGVSFFLFSLFKGRAGGLMPGGSGSSEVMLQDKAGNKINPPERQPMDGYQITEIDDNIISYYGFTNKEGAWVVMREDTQTSSFRYARGDSEFPQNWDNREKLTYDYFHNVF